MSAPAARLRMVHSGPAPACRESGMVGLLAAVADLTAAERVTLVAWAAIRHPEAVRDALGKMRAVERQCRTVGLAPELRPSAETTVAWGEDTRCAECCCPLPAGAPAWVGDSDRVTCADCTTARAGTR